MRRRFGILLLATAAALLASCDPPPPPIPPDPLATTGAPSSPRPLPAEAEVSAALLTPAELGRDYAATAPQNSGAAQLGEGVQGCSGAADPSPAPQVSAQAVAQAGMLGPFVAEVITVSSEQAAQQVMVGLSRVTTECPQISQATPEGLRVSFALGQLTFPAMGEGVQAYRLTATVEGIGLSLFAHVVSVRAGDMIVTVTLMKMSSPEVAETEKIVKDALSKARQRLKR